LPEPKAFSEQKREGPLVQAGRLTREWTSSLLSDT
jgi:hypothetical protein